MNSSREYISTALIDRQTVVCFVMNTLQGIGKIFLCFFGLLLLLSSSLVHGQTLGQEVRQSIETNALQHSSQRTTGGDRNKLSSNIHPRIELLNVKELVPIMSPGSGLDTLGTIFENKMRSIQKKRNIWLSLMIASAIAGGVSKMIADNSYAEYRSATNDATDLHKKVVIYDLLFPSSLGLSATSLLFTAMNHLRLAILRRDFNALIRPDSHS